MTFSIKERFDVADFLNDLNEPQRKAVEDTEGPNLIVAGAGSGKTRVLTYRIAYLLQKGVSASSILALTFTNKAAREMKERIGALVGEKNARYLWMGTFHSVFSKILRSKCESLGYQQSFSIYDTEDSRNLIKGIIKEMQLDEQTYKVYDVHARISMAKNNLVTPPAYASNVNLVAQDRMNHRSELYRIFQTYQNRCKMSNAMDFDDLLLNTNILFRDNQDVLTEYRNRFRYILVDEYQDTNFAQYLIIKKLAEGHRNICVVGDDAQSIYSFRGAKIENILNFKVDYPDYHLHKLEQNYRSTKNIVNAANSLIAKNAGQIPKKVWSENQPGEKIRVLRAITDAEEGFLVSMILEDKKQREDSSYDQFAILYRTNAQSRIFEDAFRRKNIPYRIYGGISFYQRKEIKDVMSYFRLVANNEDNEAFKRIVNYPARGIGKTTLDKLETVALDNNLSLFNVLKNPGLLSVSMNSGTIAKLMDFANLIMDFSNRIENTDAFELAYELISRSGILAEMNDLSKPEELNRKQNVEELLNAIKDFTEDQSKETSIQPVTLGMYIENVSLLTDLDENSNDKDVVRLMTVHSAKGLEFDYVFIVGVEKDLFPFRLSSTSIENLEEERRLFYVAVTRARKQVFISFSENRYRWGSLVSCTPSQFIEDIDSIYLDLPYNIQYQNPVSESRSFKRKAEARVKSDNLQASVQPKIISPKKLVNLNDLNKAGNQGNLDDYFLEVGMVVEHERFGRGKVIAVEGESSSKKAMIDFETEGKKQLLLKFAKLKIVSSN